MNKCVPLVISLLLSLDFYLLSYTNLSSLCSILMLKVNLFKLLPHLPKSAFHVLNLTLELQNKTFLLDSRLASIYVKLSML